MRGWISMAEEALGWLKTISTQLDTQNVLLQALVAGQQRTQLQLMTISKIYIEAGKEPTAEWIAGEVRRLMTIEEPRHG